ncbi:MAG: hypothetical protein K0V04_40160 [Deltaproteobacteria bacterium]|nr:hypothetical protein [Deltaproteobacteria bacterium]
MTLREARDRYLANAGLSTDSYHEDWVDIRFAGLPLRLPSPAARKRVLPLHDIHHALTGYQADILGEAEIGAWELGTGLGPHVIGYPFVLLALAWSPMVAPRRVFRAFVRGRRTGNFYCQPPPDDVLDQDLHTLRRQLGLDHHDPRARFTDVVAFVGWFALALFFGVFGVLLLPLMLVLGVWAQWQTRHTAAHP